MNERIKELELQAYVEVKQPWRDPSSGYVQEITVKEFSREKFAELIVRECSAICIEVSNINRISDTVYEGDVCSAKIKENFGVE